MWKLMDDVWDDLGCCNINVDAQKIGNYYNHPIWLLYGFFVDEHELALEHRRAIVNWLCFRRDKIATILDYGGGFGTLARMIAKRDANFKIDIYEPHPTSIAIIKAKEYVNISYVDSIKIRYDCLITLDVIEHCIDPLTVFSEMIETVKINGFLLIANNFSPCIKCHLPSTFHLRYTFNLFTKLMGLKFSGPCQGSHVRIFQKISENTADHNKIVQLEKLSKILFPMFSTAHNFLRKLKYLFK
jgi:2-polyprenyl-6-hydroxyphenyl methylase/3-demethylubiquinone-9 3-methyltransferase